MATLARCEFDATDEAGNLLANVSVTVRREGGGLVQVYSDRAGTAPLGNPFTATDGRVGFHAPGGAYRITLTAGSLTRERRYVAIGLAAETDFTLSRPSGTWDDEATYEIGDLVYHNDYLFISRIDANLNNEPDATTPGDTTQWMFAGAAVEGPPGTGDRFDLALYIGGKPRPGETVLRHVFSGTGISFAAGLTLSAASAEAAATGTAVFTLEKNGTEIGTVTFDASDEGLFAMASTTSFEQGDILSLTAPETRDATLANVSITLAGNRT